MKICVLLSGGIDSSATALHYKTSGYSVFPLFIDYGQAAAESELKASRRVAKYLQLPAPAVIRINKLSQLKHPLVNARSSNKSLQGKFKKEYFPNRNLLLLSIATVYAHANKIKLIALGIKDGGAFSYPDTREAFLQKVNVLFWESDKMEVLAPFIKWQKKKVIKFLTDQNFDISITYSCNVQSGKPCGSCNSCIEKKRAIKK